MKELSDADKENIIDLYRNNVSIKEISIKYRIGERRVRKILLSNNIEIKNIHKKINSNDTYCEDNESRFQIVEGKKYVAICTIDGKVFDDYLNKSGALTSYLKNIHKIDIPSLFLRKKYFKENKKQWYEQWFTITLVDNVKKETKKCPYCDWETTDVNNKSGMFMTHLLKEHGITIKEYLSQHPEDKDYFSKQNSIIEKEEKLNNVNNYVICPICGEKMEKITFWHIKNKHNLEYDQFKKLYPECKVISDNMLNQTLDAQALTNLVVSKDRFISKYEREIRALLDQYNIEYEANRQILIGKEIDILIPSLKIGIEFDGLKWHTEWFGKKTHSYHLDKTRICNERGYGLIHIFEDEYVNSKDIVINKLKHILKIECGCKKIMGRKCVVKEIYKNDAEIFLNKFHIQGYSPSSIYIGAFYNNQLIAVMSFKNGNLKNKCWELTRFATDYNYICQGIGGKLFNFFVKVYNPAKVISFADRRWTVNINDNLYTKLGFKIDTINKPDYKYYNENVDRYKRIHKMYFNKQKLHKKYGFPLTMTETEMAKELKYDRIWDCGLVKYIWER